MAYWLMKSEPGNYSISDLQRDERTWWTGVRNYQARNYMNKSMKTGDLAFFYHSNATPSGIAGLMRISKAAKADETAFDKKSQYYEPKATRENPIWECVEVEFLEAYPKILSLAEIREDSKLASMVLLQKGSRLSVQPVLAVEFKRLLHLIKLSG